MSEPSDDELEGLSALAQSIALRAGELILDVTQERSALRASARTKSSRTDLVTDADRASEAMIVRALLKARPDDAILGEESGLRAGRSGVTWVVDPLDGTTNFVYGFASFAVSIAARTKTETLVGVVHDPQQEETFVARKGAGGFLNDIPIQRNLGAQALSEALVGTGFSYDATRRRHQAELLTKVLPAAHDIRRAGAAALDLCYVAQGRLDLYYEAGLQEWDRAAGLLVAFECGLDHIELTGPIPDAPTLVVGPRHLCEQLADLLSSSP